MPSCVICKADINEGARFCPACGAEQPKDLVQAGDDPLLGQIIARNFKIEKVLGVGGMGKVYKARQMSLDKAVVIKVLHEHFREDAQLVQRFQREAKAASRLNHPNSIQVIDFGQDDSGVLFMAIEFLDGVDLFTLLQENGPLEDTRLAKIMIQVCSALGEAHHKHVIHRDLKPENIMVMNRRGEKDIVKVLDFGIAKIQDSNEGSGEALTQVGMVCGTPEYMSPEQARGQSLDSRCDLYSLGVLAYQMMSGKLPFDADSPIGMVTKHIIEEPVYPHVRNPNIKCTPEMEAIVMKAMAKSPDKRFQSAEEMGKAFENVLMGFGGFTAEISRLKDAPENDLVAVDSSTLTAESSVSKVLDVNAFNENTTQRNPTNNIEESTQQLAMSSNAGNAKKIILVAAIAMFVGIFAIMLIKKNFSSEASNLRVDAGNRRSEKNSDDLKKNDLLAKEPPKKDEPKKNTPQKLETQEPEELKKEDAVSIKPGTGEEKKAPRKKKNDRAKALKLVKKAQLELIAHPDKAYDLLKKAMYADSSYAESRRLIALYHFRKKNQDKACMAMKDYIVQKGRSMSGSKRKKLLKMVNCL